MKLKDLVISEEAESAMRQDALKAFPDECCGFFYGSENNQREIVQAIPTQNVKEGDKRRRFTIDPLEYMKAEQYAAKNNTTLLGIYHSHPLHPAIPSEHDRVQAMPWFSYVILSVHGENVKDVRSYQLDADRQFQEEKILS